MFDGESYVDVCKIIYYSFKSPHNNLILIFSNIFLHFHDISMEELRLHAYDVQKQGSSNTYVCVCL